MNLAKSALNILGGIAYQCDAPAPRQIEHIVEYLNKEFPDEIPASEAILQSLSETSGNSLLKTFGESVREFAGRNDSSANFNLVETAAHLLLAGTKVNADSLKLALVLGGFLGVDLEGILREIIRES
jgi:O-acetyl-ADP-ribose deacetylase (regulator of RNase III)